jgi:chromosome segregation ATPase
MDETDGVTAPDPANGENSAEAVAGIDDYQERIAALDAMLRAAREREQQLTVDLIRQRAKVTGYEGKISELGAIAARVASAEASRRDAEAAAADHEQELKLAQAETEALRTEVESLRSRSKELEAELAAASDQLAEAAVARTEASRLEKERNDARERAHAERRLAAADRIRAAEAELRATQLQGRLRVAERRIVELSTAAHRRGANGSPDEEERTSPPVIELQRANAASEDPEAPPRPDVVIDLTEMEEDSAEGPEEETEATPSEEATGSGSRVEDRPAEDTWVASAPAEESRFHRLLHPRRRR